MKSIPSVLVLDAFNPANSGTGEEVLRYENLGPAVVKYRSTFPERAQLCWESKPGSYDEKTAATQLASEYLLRTSLKLVESDESNRDLWADRFTQASVELHGSPERDETLNQLVIEYDELTQLIGDERVSQDHLTALLNAYRPLVATNGELEIHESVIDAEKEALRQFGEAIRDKFQPLFDIVDAAEKEMFEPQDLVDIFTKALKWLEENEDSDWGEWTVVENDAKAVSVNASTKTIKVGMRREAATAKEVHGLIAHELLVHAMRAKNGYKTGDKQLATGLPGYLETEEGTAIFAEGAITGEKPDKDYDRYIDIALALGVVDGKQKTRQELFQISFARQLIRAQVKGTVTPEMITVLERKVWAHIDRIYRGGPGDNIGSRQGIFTKDIVYYVGYKRMARFIAESLAAGKTAREIYEYLTQAKIDPTNPDDVEYLENAKKGR